MIAVLVCQQDRSQVGRAQPSVAQVPLDRALRQATVDQQRRAVGLDQQRVAAAA